jgi:1-acyl-sn-glycerol-3-phosphate acyltransferase
MPMDVPIIAVEFFETFGADRPLYCLAHDVLFTGVNGPIMHRFGFVPATRDAAHEILTSGAVTIVFPGGDWDSFRPTLQANVIDFNGRTGYVRTALKAGVPIVPVVSVGGQEAQFHLTRGEWIGRRSPLRRFMRSDLFPLTIGFPFGLTPAGLNLPLPTKIVTQVLDPIDIEAEFGPEPDVNEVDAAVRARMQDALDELARERRFPVLG